MFPGRDICYIIACHKCAAETSDDIVNFLSPCTSVKSQCCRFVYAGRTPFSYVVNPMARWSLLRSISVGYAQQANYAHRPSCRYVRKVGAWSLRPLTVSTTVVDMCVDADGFLHKSVFIILV